MRDGQERRREIDAPQNGRGPGAARCRSGEARRQPADGVLRAAVARPAGSRSDDRGAAAQGLPGGVHRCAPQPRGRVSVLRRRDRQEDPRALGRREDAARARAHAPQPPELSRARRAHEPPRSGDQGDAA